MRTVHLAALAGVLAAATLLAAVDLTVGLGGWGWLVGLVVAVFGNAALARGLDRAGATSVGFANGVTLTRATLLAAVAALVADSFATAASVAVPVVVLSVPALLLDAVDGAVARRTATATAIGARFDMEVDALLIMVLSVFVARSAGHWVAVIGLARYAFLLVGETVPWMRARLPFRYWRKVVAATAGVVLTFSASGFGPPPVTALLLMATVALLAESFGRDVVWLWTNRPAAEPRRAVTSPAGTGPVHRSAERL